MMTIAIKRKQWNINWLCYLFLIFITGCFVRWVYEEVFYWITEGLLRNLDGLICFRSVVSFAVMGLVFHYLLELTAEHMVGKLPPN